MLDAQEAASADAKALRIAKAEMKIVAAQNERVKYQLALAGQKYSDIPEYTAAVKKIQQLTMAYNQSAAAASNAAKAYNAARNEAVAAGAPIVAQKAQQSMVALGTSIDVVNAHAIRTNRILAVAGTGMQAFGAKGKAAMLAVAGATRTATVAALGLAKSFLPMLVISGAIAGIDYLVNRSKRAAEARNEAAELVVANAKKAAEAERQKQVTDNAAMKNLEAMAKYSRLTTDEQGKAKDMITQLTGRYSGLADQINIVNGKLVIAKDAWKNLTEAQRKAFVDAEQQKFDSLIGSIQAKKEGLNFEWSKLDTAKIFFGFSSAEKKFKEMYKAAYSGTAKDYEQLANFASKNNMTDLAKKASEIAELMREAKAINDVIAKGGKVGVSAGGSIAGTPEQIKKYTDAVNALKERRKSDAFAAMNEEQKLQELAKREKDLRDKFAAAGERAANDRGAALESVKYAEQLLDLEKQRAEIMQSAEQKRAEKLQHNAELEMNFYTQLLNSATRLRATAQTGIDANSAEALSMQSRRMGSGNGLQAAAKSAADAAEKAAEASKKSAEILAEMRKVQESIYDQLKGFGVSEL